MRVTLVHNTTAGWGVLAHDDLVAALKSAGHEVHEGGDLDADLGHHLRHNADVVVAAGGDGTMLSVAKRLLHKPVPMILLPLGTANNLGRSLGMHPDINQLLSIIANPCERTLDLGVATGTWGTKYFCESAGVGWFSDALNETMNKEDKAVPKARQKLAEYLESYQPRFWDLSIDNQNCSGEYVLIDVLNAGMFGPNLLMGQEANPSDGSFEVVLVTPGDRSLLLDYLHSLGKGETPDAPSLLRRRARHVRIALGERRLRLDGTLFPREGEMESPFADLRVLPGAVRVWLSQPAVAAKAEPRFKESAPPEPEVTATAA